MVQQAQVFGHFDVFFAGLPGQVVRMGRRRSQGGASDARAVAHGSKATVLSSGEAGGHSRCERADATPAADGERAYRAGFRGLGRSSKELAERSRRRSQSDYEKRARGPAT